MKVNIKTDLITKIPSDVITLGIDAKNQTMDSVGLDKKTVNYIKAVLVLGDLSEKVGSTMIVYGDHFYPKILLVRVGDPKLLTANLFYSAVLSMANKLKPLKFKNLLIPINQFINTSLSAHAVAEYSVRGLMDVIYDVNSLKTINKVKQNIFQTIIHYDGTDLVQVKKRGSAWHGNDGRG